jgi:hypothetical protein
MKLCHPLLLLIILPACLFAQADSTGVNFGKELDKIFNTEVIMEVDSAIFGVKQNNF